MLALDIQHRLLALGYELGRGGPDRNGVDGDLGEISQAAILAALATGRSVTGKSVTGKVATARPAVPSARTFSAGGSTVPADWTPPADIRRIIAHWTAGGHRASALDKAHYHLLIEGDGALVRGRPSIALNGAGGCRPGYAAHTRNCNTGSIGVSLCCMAGAVERPFDPGRAPMTRAQWERLPAVLADLCGRYRVPVGPTTVLSHAEVETTLRIAQRGKWDIARLAFDPTIAGAAAVGDLLRRRVSAAIGS